MPEGVDALDSKGADANSRTWEIVPATGRQQGKFGENPKGKEKD